MIDLLHLPPSGVGVYARAQSIAWLAQWRFVALPYNRSDTPAKAAALLERGVRVWLYSGPESWEPDAYVATIGRIVATHRSLRTEGIIANPETGWPAMARSDRDRRAADLGTRLATVASDNRVGLTSYAAWPGLAAAGDACRGKVWGSPEFYHEADWSGYWARWQAAFGVDRTIIDVGAWPHAEARYHDAQSYRAYLDTLPTCVGAIAWTTGETPAYMWPVLHDWSPSPLALRPVLEARALFATWPGRIAIAVILVLIVLAALRR